MPTESDDGQEVLPDTVSRFEAALLAGKLLDAVDLIPGLPKDRGRSAAAVMETALSADDLAVADAVVQRFSESGFVPPGTDDYVAELFRRRGEQGVRELVAMLNSSEVG